MKCKNCGYEQTSNTARFCPECGECLVGARNVRNEVQSDACVRGPKSKYEEWEGTTNGMVFVIVAGGIFLAIAWIMGLSILPIRIMITIGYITTIWKWLEKKGIV